MLLVYRDKIITKIAKEVFFKVQKLLGNLEIKVNILHIYPQSLWKIVEKEMEILKKLIIIQEFIKEYKKLLSDEEFFLGFGKYTEPHKDGLLASFVHQLKQNPFDIIPLIDIHFQPLKQVPDSLLTVKKMEDQKIVGSCSEYAFLTAATLRLVDYPSALLFTLKPSWCSKNQKV